MLKVHVWMPDPNHVGHTAISFGGQYVSFWPEDAAGKKDLKIKRSHPGAMMASLAEDIAAEGNRHPITIEIARFDEAKLVDHVTSFQESIPRYQLAKNNCSHVVADCLYAATGLAASFVPNAAMYGKLGRTLGRGIWTPDQVLRYARELAQKSKRSSR